MEDDFVLTQNMKKGRKQLAVAVILGHAIKHIYLSALPLLTAHLKIDRGFNGKTYGIINGAQRATNGSTTMVAGYLGERFANKAGLMLCTSLTLMGASYFFLGIAPSFWWVFLAMLIIGIGPALYHPPAIASLSRKFPDKRGFAISLHGTGGSVGQMLGPLVVGLLSTETFRIGSLVTVTYMVAFKWDQILRVGIIPAFVFAIIVYLMMRNIPTSSTNTTSFKGYYADLRDVLSNRSMQGLIFVTGFRSMATEAVTIFLPVYLLSDISEGGLGKTDLTVGLYLAGSQVAGIAVQPLMGWLSDRYGRKIILIPSMTMLGMLFIGLYYNNQGAPLAINILLMGCFLYSLHTIFIAAAMDVAQGKSQATVVSLIYAATTIGFISPFIAGILTDIFNLKIAFVYSGVIVILSTMLLLFVKLPKVKNANHVTR
jgi:MFS family permease